MSGLIHCTFPFVLVGPTGSGKTTVVRKLLEERQDVRFSVSATTRAPRVGERDGVHYIFLERAEFEDRRERGALLEWAEVHGELYGTPGENLEQAKTDGVHLLLDIDVQGARAVRAAVPEAVSVFLLPPQGEWLSRLQGRGSETGVTLQRRLRTALAELKAVGEFDYVLVNDDLETTVGRISAILNAEESRTTRVGRELSRLVSALEREIHAG